MKNIIAFSGSNSKSSINKQLAVYAANQITNVKVNVLDLNDFELPIYSIDYENDFGFPNNATKFLENIKKSDGIVLSLAEHNGSFTVVFKNLFDWMSRIDRRFLNNIPMLLMATSPGGRGGTNVLENAKGQFPHMGGNIVAEFSLPSFGSNFQDNNITDDDLSETFKRALSAFELAL